MIMQGKGKGSALWLALLFALLAIAGRETGAAPPLRDPQVVIVYPEAFNVVHDPPGQTSNESMWIENLRLIPRTFTIHETAEDCQTSEPLLWVQAFPAQGTIPAEGSVEITLSFNDEGLLNGTYQGTLCVQTNDPQTPRIPVALSLRVGGLPTATPIPSPTVKPPTATPIPSPTAEPPTATPIPSPTAEPPMATLTPSPTAKPPMATLTPSPTAKPPMATPTAAPPTATGTPGGKVHTLYLPVARRR